MNQKLDLEMIEQPFISFANMGWVGLLMLTISLVVLMFTFKTYQNKHAEYTDLASRLSELSQQQQVEIPAKQAVATVSAEEKKEIVKTVDLLTIPWQALFDAIEQSDMTDVALLGLEPDAKKQRVIITGEAKNLQVALDYIVRLEQQPMLAQVFLMKHQIDEAGTTKQVNFTVMANWKTSEK